MLVNKDRDEFIVENKAFVQNTAGSVCQSSYKKCSYRFFRKEKNNDYLVFENGEANEHDYIDKSFYLNIKLESEV